MRILIMANNVQELGGAQRVVHVLAQGLGSRGHDVVIIGVVPNQPPHVYESSPTYDTVTLLDDPYPKDASARLAQEGAAIERLRAGRHGRQRQDNASGAGRPRNSSHTLPCSLHLDFPLDHPRRT